MKGSNPLPTGLVKPEPPPNPPIPKIVFELPEGDSRIIKTWFPEWRGDTLHVCVTISDGRQS